MSPPPIPRMSKNEARGNQYQRQSEAIRGNQAAPQVQSGAIRGNQMQSEAIGPHLRCNQVQSGAIRGNRAAPQVQSGAIRCNQVQSDAISIVFPCFRVLGGPQGPVFCVFVFWAGTTGLCFVFSCFGRPPSKHSTGSTASTAPRRSLDSSTARQSSTELDYQTSTPRRMQSASTCLEHGLDSYSTATRVLDSYSTATRQLLDRLDRQGLDSPSTAASTAARRSLDSSTARQPGLKIHPGYMYSTGYTQQDTSRYNRIRIR